jgi:hypothetical protein
MTVPRLEPDPQAAAPALASATVNLHVTQAANQTRGVHAVLPAEVAG